MKKMFLFWCFLFEINIFYSLSGYCLDYTISFTGSGLSNTVDSVKVTNLNKGSSVLVPANSKLHLTNVTTAVKLISDCKENEIFAFNSSNYSTITFNALFGGTTHTYIYDISGRLVIENSSYFYSGYHSYEVSLSSGLYLIHIIGNNYKYSLKIIRQNTGKTQPRIVVKDETSSKTILSKIKNEHKVDMIYSDGDRLVFRACNGNYRTLLSDIPTTDKNIEFQFSECKDPDGRHYVTTKIGNQVWIAENYAYLPYVNNYKEDDKTSFSMSDVYNYMYYYVIDYNGHNLDSAKNTSYYKKYGACYNLAAALNSAPVGWHLPTLEEWETLKNYLITNGYGVGGSGSDIAKSLSANYGWNKNQTAYYIAENQTTLNNSSCFSALPGGGKTTGTGNYGNSGNWWTSSYGSTTTCVDSDNKPTQCIHNFYCMQISNYRIEKDLLRLSLEHYQPINVRYIKN